MCKVGLLRTARQAVQGWREDARARHHSCSHRHCHISLLSSSRSWQREWRRKARILQHNTAMLSTHLCVPTHRLGNTSLHDQQSLRFKVQCHHWNPRKFSSLLQFTRRPRREPCWGSQDSWAPYFLEHWARDSLPHSKQQAQLVTLPQPDRNVLSLGASWH